MTKIKAIHSLSGLFAVVNRISRFMKESINVLKYTDSGGLWKIWKLYRSPDKSMYSKTCLKWPLSKRPKIDF